MSDKGIYQQDSTPQGGDSIKAFQLTATPEQKKSKDFGIAIARDVWGKVNSGVGGYFYSRNARFIKNRNYANGRINVQAMFQDRFNFDAKMNYINLNWNALQIVNRIVSGLVGRWMSRNEKVSVTAIDTLSVKEKQDEYENLEFILYNREMLEKLQAESGVQLIPQDQYIPDDKEALELWQAQFQRLPEEVLYEMGCNDVLAQNGWFDVLKEKMLHDAAEVLFVGTYTWMDKEGVIHVKWIKPEDAIYSYSDYPDLRDTTWRGVANSLRISEIRRRFGKEFNPENPYALTEEEIFTKIATRAKEYQLQTNLTWQDNWYNAYLRPYDEWNVRALEFEFKTIDKDPYTVTKTKSGTTYTEKGMPQTASGKRREKPKENQKVVEDEYWNIYECVFLPDCDTLLKWDVKKNMIRPQDPKEIGAAEFSYSFFMPQNYQMRNLAIPEKIEAAVDGMILALLKMQQLVARMRPTGAAVNLDALQNIDYGLGDESNKSIDYKKLFDQTGDIYYRGRDAEGNPIPVPIQELANSGFLAQMDGLIRNYQFNYQILKDELGEDPNLMNMALQPRVTSENVQASQQSADNATGYIYNAYLECMKITARKISCLLKDSVKYGAKAYRNIIKAEDIGERQFTTDIKMLPTEFEVQRFDAIMNEAMRSTPGLVLHIDPFRLMRVARENVKLAEILFRQGQKSYLLNEQQTAQQNQQATIQGQIDAAKEAEAAKRETEKLKGKIEIDKVKTSGDATNKTAIVSMVTQLLSKGVPISPELQPIVNAVMENIFVSAVAQTDEQKQAILAKMQQAQAEQAAQQQSAQGQPEPGQQEMMPEAGAEQMQQQSQQPITQ